MNIGGRRGNEEEQGRIYIYIITGNSDELRDKEQREGEELRRKARKESEMKRPGKICQE